MRLKRAKELLKVRLSRRGIAVPAGLLIAGAGTHSATAALPAALVCSTVDAVMIQATRGIVSLAVAKLAADFLKNMVLIKLVKTGASVIVALAAVVSVGGLAASSGMLRAGQAQSNDPTQAPASWIGRKVVTKYDAPIMAGN